MRSIVADDTVTAASDSPGPQFATGRYRLKMIAFDVSSNPLLLPCPAWLGVPSIGKSVTLELDVVKDGVEWVGRPSGAAGDIEVRFRNAGSCRPASGPSPEPFVDTPRTWAFPDRSLRATCR